MISAVFLACYAFGNVSFSYLAQCIFSFPDLRHNGSGNMGASNTWRLGGGFPALMALLGDVAKGYGAIHLAFYIEPTLYALHVGALAVVLGHIYPAVFSFKGGKGVATSAGVFLALCWPLGLALATLWTATLALTRKPSAASLLTSFVAPWVFALALDKAAGLCVGLIACIVIFAHRENIARLVNNRESTL